MKSFHTLILLLSAYLIMACEGDQALSPPPEVRISGQILHAIDQSPFANWEVSIEDKLGWKKSFFTDSDGKYELSIGIYQQLLLDEGFDQAEVDSMFVRNDYSFEVKVASGANPCDFISIAPGISMSRFERFRSLPIIEEWNFDLYPAAPWQFQFQDTASVSRNFSVAAQIDARGLDQTGRYTGWAPLELDLVGNMGSDFCLPIDVPVEIKYRLVEYTQGNFDTPISDRTFLDTLTMTTAGLGLYMIEY
ncbi:MAG: hypothetical protein AAF696_19025 [Bacteroidota bacterium]